jgi:hypothetical protein
VDTITAQAEAGFASVEEELTSVQEILTEVAFLLAPLFRAATEAA